MIIFFPNIVDNSWFLLTDNVYFIPAESNIFIFKVTKMNDGSGDWWLYGEDNKYYYGLNIDEGYDPKYYKLDKGKETINFDKHDYNTWDNKE
jgi:hypothetical protein